MSLNAPKWRKDNAVALENEGTRLDIVEKVTGRAKYATDHYPANLIWAAYVRCPYGKARLRSVDEAAARQVKGVLEVQIDKRAGRYPGDRLGHVCGDSRSAVEAALRALAMKFEIDRPATRLEVEARPLEEVPPPGNAAAADTALASAAHVVERTYQTQVQVHCSLEPHAIVVDCRDDSATAHVSTQANFACRAQLAEALKLPPNRVQVHCEYVGGGFGSKFGIGPEGALAARMSRKFNRPCRVVCDRREEMTDTGMRPGSMQYMKIGIDGQGKLLGGRVHTWGSVGPTGGGGGVRNPSRYRFGTIARSHEDVNLNSGFPAAMRAPGHPQALFAIELMMDELAGKGGIDPVEFRLRNDDNATRREMLQVGAELIGWKDRRPDGTSPGPIKRGFGVGVADWGNGRGEATVTVNIYRDGTVEALSGAQDIGTGFRTLLADCVRSQIGDIPRKLVVARVGDSSLPPGPASGGSVTSRFVAPKAFNAALQARQVLLKLVSVEWGGVDPATLRVTAGEVTSTDGRSMSWEKACKLISGDRLTITTSEDGPFWKAPTGSEAVQFVDLTVDVETGIVRVRRIVALQEVGLPVNRSALENQITGGVIQGLSFCLFEDRILNRQTGAPVNANMDFYKIAGSMDIPEITTVLWRSREDSGVNSVGEPPVIPTPGAIACAVANAIGRRVTTMPLTPAKILAALARDGGVA